LIAWALGRGEFDERFLFFAVVDERARRRARASTATADASWAGSRVMLMEGNIARRGEARSDRAARRRADERARRPRGEDRVAGICLRFSTREGEFERARGD